MTKRLSPFSLDGHVCNPQAAEALPTGRSVPKIENTGKANVPAPRLRTLRRSTVIMPARTWQQMQLRSTTCTCERRMYCQTQPNRYTRHGAVQRFGSCDAVYSAAARGCARVRHCLHSGSCSCLPSPEKTGSCEAPSCGEITGN